MLDQNSQLKKFYQTNMVIKVAFGSCLVEKSEFHQIWWQGVCEIHRFHLQCKAPTRIGALKTENF